jgi:hypothetical protein
MGVVPFLFVLFLSGHQTPRWTASTVCCWQLRSEDPSHTLMFCLTTMAALSVRLCFETTVCRSSSQSITLVMATTRVWFKLQGAASALCRTNQTRFAACYSTTDHRGTHQASEASSTIRNATEGRV